MLPPLFRTTAIVCPVSPCTAIRPGHAILRGFLVQPQNIILPLLVVAEIFVSRIRIFGSFFSLPFVRFVSLLFKKRPGPRFSLCLLRIFAAKKFVSRICISSSFFSLPFVCFVSLLFKIISPRFSFVLRAAPLKPPLWSFWSFSSFAFLCGPCVRTCFSPFHSRPFASIRGSLFSLPFVRFVSLLFKKRPGPAFLCAFCAFLRLKNLFREFAFPVRLFLFPSFALLLCCSKSSRPVFLLYRVRPR